MTTTIDAAHYAAARDIFLESTANDGGTFTLEGKPVTTGIAVTSAVLATVERLTIFGLLEAIEGFETDLHLGTWFDAENGVWEISASVTFDDRASAMELARVLGERYVYDIDNQDCLAVA